MGLLKFETKISIGKMTQSGAERYRHHPLDENILEYFLPVRKPKCVGFEVREFLGEVISDPLAVVAGGPDRRDPTGDASGCFR